MKIQFIENQLTAKEFLALRQSVGWQGKEEQIANALLHSLYVVQVCVNGETVGMGRLVGDGSIIVYLQDVVVAPKYQGMGLGRGIVELLLAYVRGITPPGNTIAVGLMAAKGKESFYQHLGFVPRPNENEDPGMMMRIAM